jgi:hypothetical protein
MRQSRKLGVKDRADRLAVRGLRRRQTRNERRHALHYLASLAGAAARIDVYVGPSGYADLMITAADPASGPKATLHYYYRRQRDNLLAKVTGLGERDMRRPMTPTGTNLLGLLKHVGSVQLGYFGEVFDRPSGRKLPWFDDDAEADADMWAPASQSSEEIFDLWRHSCDHADATIDALDLDATGTVPWWPEERRHVTLHGTLGKMTVEPAGLAAHADIIRELTDGSAGNNDRNLTDRSADEWAAHRARVEQAAEQAAERAAGYSAG